MNLEDIRKNVIKSAYLKLDRHKNLGAQSNLSISEVAELLDIVHGMTDESRSATQKLINSISLN